jgi:hypothetical protein
MFRRRPRRKEMPSRRHSIFQTVRVFCQSDVESLYPLIAGYIERPELAESVIEFALDTDQWRSRYTWRIRRDVPRAVPCPLVDDESRARVEEYVRGMGLDDKVVEYMISALQWKGGQANNSEPWDLNLADWPFAYTAATILLSLCKNITTLYLGILDKSVLSIYIMLASMGRLAQPALQKVKHVEFIPNGHCGDEEYYAHMNLTRYFNLICRLPALESIVVDGVVDWDTDYQGLPVRTSSLKKLRMTHSHFSSSSLAAILTLAKGLEEFTFLLGSHLC